MKEVQSGEGNGPLCVGANRGVTENTTIHLLGHTWITLHYGCVLGVCRATRGAPAEAIIATRNSNVKRLKCAVSLYGCSMICRMSLQMCISLFLMISLSSLALAIVPETSHLGNIDQPTFVRHFWSTSDKHHYRLSEDGEVAQIILDKQSGNPSDVGVWRGR